jgi:hypothetical protein
MTDDAMLYKVRCFDGYWNTLVYPEPIKHGGVVWVSPAIADKMMKTQTGIAIEEKKLKVNKPKRKTTRRTKADGKED